MRILVIGASGQVGDKVVRNAVSRGDIVFATHKSRSPAIAVEASFQMDKADASQVAEVLGKVRPEAVVDTGALHNVDYCETHREEAFAVNARGTGNIAERCREMGLRFVFVSTDFVFDGVGAPYTEDSKPNPLSVYAESKLEGEKVTFKTHPSGSVVVRPSVIYSWVEPGVPSQSSSGKPLNFAAWLVAQLRSRKEVNIVNDQVASPTLASDLAGAILALLDSPRTGLFHTAGATPLSRYDFAVEIAKELGLNHTLIRPVPTSQLNQVARRPLDSSLLSHKIKREIGYEMMDIRKALQSFAEEA